MLVAMSQKSRNNLIAYAVLIGFCLIVAFIYRVWPEFFVQGPPAWKLFLSFRGTAVVALLGLIGIFFLNLSSLRGLWDSDLTAKQKVVIPVLVGIVFGLVNIALRQFTSFDAVLAEFIRSLGLEKIAPPLVGAILGYLSGGILINIVYFLILIPPIVYFVSDRLLKGKKQGIVYWSIATPLALWEPLTNPPLSFSIDAFGIMGAIGVVFMSAVFTMLQAWFMYRFGFVALVFVRLGLYIVTHVFYPMFS
jgi:hypothetical protein